ncbi:MAG: helix-turn-helix transcriptional regulator [Trichlorobacter sp.]|nr:helix-turn-helix transcriptional regulator [Trichlorobacter sp.]
MHKNKTPAMVVELLKKAVAEKGQSGVAKETGLTQPAIHRYLKGIGEPGTKTLKKLADYFGVSVTVLRGESLPARGFYDSGFEFSEDVSVFEKYAYFTQTQFQWALNGKEPFFSENIYFLHSTAEQATDLLKLPESFYSNINPGVWEALKIEAQIVIEKYQKALETADDETKAFFFKAETVRTRKGNFYDLVTTPDYFTRLTATFDSILSLALKSKQAQQNKMFIAAAVSLAKLLRDMPSELSDMYDAEYMEELKKLARKVVKEVDAEHLLERWTPPSIQPKLKQTPAKESAQNKKQRKPPKNKVKP